MTSNLCLRHNSHFWMVNGSVHGDPGNNDNAAGVSCASPVTMKIIL